MLSEIRATDLEKATCDRAGIGSGLPGPRLEQKCHLVIWRLAWLQMTDEQRAAVTAILKKHPHYEPYLTKSKPDGFAVDEWAFMRAGPWADWIRGGQARAYVHSEWHYINYPICFPGLGQSEEKHQPPAGQENAVWSMNRCLEKIKNGTDEERPSI